MQKKHAADHWLMIIAIGLTAFGIIMIQSASYYSTMETTGPYYYATKQFQSAIIGIVAMIIMWNFNYMYIKKFTVVIYIFSFVMLFLVPFVGVTINGARRWIYILGTSVQPSDFAKIALIIALAHMFSSNSKNIRSAKFIALSLILTGLFAGLVLAQPNMSTTVCIIAIAIAMLFAAGLHWSVLAFFGSAGLAGVIAMMVFMPYRMQRLEAFWDPWAEPLGSGYQLIQSLYAIGSGGLTGVGIGQSMQSKLYIPFAESDFIFAIIAEEVGFIGCILLFIAFAIFIWRGILIAHRSKEPFAALLATGIVCMIAIQTIVNLCVVTGAIPPTGIPLPFISYGGTSLMVMLASVGILLNISRYTELPAPQNARFRIKLGKNSIWNNK